MNVARNRRSAIRWAGVAVAAAVGLLGAGCAGEPELVGSVASGTTVLPPGLVLSDRPGELPKYVPAVPGSGIAERDRRMLAQDQWPSAEQLTECSWEPQKSIFVLDDDASPVPLTVVFPPGTLTLPEQIDEYGPIRSRRSPAIEFRPTPQMAEVLRAAGHAVEDSTMITTNTSFLRAAGESRRGATVSVQFGKGPRVSVANSTGGMALEPLYRQYSQRPDGSLVLISYCPDGWTKGVDQFLDWLGDRGPSSVAGLLNAARDPAERARLQGLFDSWRAELVAGQNARPKAPPWDSVDPSVRVYGDAPPPAGLVLVSFAMFFEPPALWRDGKALLCTRTVDAWNPCQPMSVRSKGAARLTGVRGAEQDVEVWILGGATTQPDRAYVVGRVPQGLLDDKRWPVFGVTDEGLAGSPPLRNLAAKSAVKDRGELPVLRFGGAQESPGMVDPGKAPGSTVP